MTSNIIDVIIEPRQTVLSSLGASKDEFDDALSTALDRLAGKPRRQLPPAKQIPIHLRGKDVLLGEIAAIAAQVARP